MEIKDHINEPALLELYAEECVEAAHKALKIARLIRGDNPIDSEVSPELLYYELISEMADVSLVGEVIVEKDIIDEESIEIFRKGKKDRWINRIKEREKNNG